MKALLFPVLGLFLAATVTPHLQAQGAAAAPAAGTTAAPNAKTTDRESDGPRRFWQGKLPGGHYMVAIDHITSISRHSYVIMEAGLIVDEVTVDTNGQSLARFYYARPVTEGVNNNAAGNLTNRAKELLDYGGERAGTDVHKMVVKKFPETTHAKSVEYRLNSTEEVGALYSSLRNAWETGRGRVFAIK